MLTTIEGKGLTWYHFSDMNEDDFSFMNGHFKFHHLDYEDVRSETIISKIDSYKHYVFCVFHVPVLDTMSGQVTGVPLFVFLSSDTLVTIERQPVAAVTHFVERMQKSAKLRAVTTPKGSAFLLYRILLAAFKDVSPIVTHLTADVGELEERVHHLHDRRTTLALSRVRRNVLFLRHIIDPQRNMLTSLSSAKRPFISTELSVYFDDLRDVLDTLWLTSDNLKLIIDGLFDVNEALLSHKTNKVVTVLTFISAALMAPALVSGFYGMNVSWLPYAEQPGFISLLLLFSFVVVVLALALVNSRR